MVANQYLTNATAPACVGARASVLSGGAPIGMRVPGAGAAVPAVGPCSLVADGRLSRITTVSRTITSAAAASRMTRTRARAASACARTDLTGACDGGAVVGGAVGGAGRADGWNTGS